jgi:hypothetical protein
LTTPADNPLTADASGLMPVAYIGVQSYKIILTTAGGTTITEEDNLPGAFNSTPFLAGAFSKPDQDFTSRTGNYTVLEADLGGIINGDCTGGSFDFTMLSAVTATNGKGVTLRHVGTANTIGIVTVSSQTITSPTTGVTTTSFELIGYGESVTLESDGSNWHVTRYVPPLLRPNTPGVILIADRVSAAPASSPGTRYIVAAAFSTFEQEDIIEDNGQGGFIEITPPTDCGWAAYVQDEDTYYAFIGSAWVPVAINIAGLTEDTNPDGTNDFLVTYDASASGHKKIAPYYVPGALIAIIEDNKAQNTAAQSLTGGADNVRELNTLVYNRDTLVSLASNRFTLPAGTWEVEWHAPAGRTMPGVNSFQHQSFLYNQTDASEVARGTAAFDTNDGNETAVIPSIGRTVVTIAASKAFEIRHRTSQDVLGGVTGNFGTEVYTRVAVRRA